MVKLGSLKDKTSVFEGNAKPSVEEMLAAMLGITSAGVRLVLRGVSTKKEIPAMAIKAAMLSSKVQEHLMSGFYDADKAASELLQFLGNKRSALEDCGHVLLSHPKGFTGGKVREIISHIDDILKREEAGTQPRAKPRFTAKGALEKPFHAPYLPRDEAAKASASPGKGMKPRPHRLKRAEAPGAASSF